MEFIDLTKEDASCVEHPIIKLVKLLSKTHEKEIVVVVSKNEVPSIKVLEIVADKLGYKIVESYEDSETIRTKFVKD